MASNPRVYATEIVFQGDTRSPSGVKLGYINGGSTPHTEVVRTEIDYHGAHHSHSPLNPFSPWMEVMGNMERNPLPQCAWTGCPEWAIKAADDYAKHNRL
jgi:hypothetical protein